MKRKPMFLMSLTPEAPAGGGDEPVVENGTPEDPESGKTDEPQEGTEEEPWDRTRAEAKIKKANAEAKGLREQKKAAEAKAATAEATAQELADTKTENLRLRVAIKYGLDERVASRLKGDTEEEMVSDAEELLALFAPKVPKGRPATALSGAANKATQAEEMPEDLDKLASQMFRN